LRVWRTERIENEAFPIDTQDLVALIVVTLLPFLPALLLEMPLNEQDLMKVMF
jgi:hypothetical protein